MSVSTPVVQSSEHARGAGTVVEARAVSVRLGDVTVLRDLTLKVGHGEIVALTGPNGSGKTTLLRTLAGLLRPTAGEVVWPSEFEMARGVALVSHEVALHPSLTLRENLDLIVDLTGRPRSDVDGALSDVGLLGAAGRLVGVCSAGMKRRAEVARVRLVSPQLLLLDEAHAALDGHSRFLIAALAGDVARDGGSVVVVSHDHSVTSGVADRVVELRRGALHEVDR